MENARNLMITSWLRDPNDPPLTIAVPGLKLTGWWPNGAPDVPVLSDLSYIWPSGAATLKIERDILDDPDGSKHQVCAYARIYNYPLRWRDLVGDSLRCFTNQGAAIAWAGGWECFLQYSPTERFSGCYAAYTVRTGLVCFGDLDEPIRYLDQVPGVAGHLHAAVAAEIRMREIT
jgi:hypothetical protein